ncbi:unnamed protein product [Amoebophrya sp. A25]|nr:unnamed protein product [Amoebophrya sp. A25]|eukprot:GSA25T00015549001.1
MGKFRKHGSKHDRGTKKRGNKGPRKDKIHGLKAGSKGVAAQYLTRAQSLKKLQLSLVDFRRLCILKGIYPRDPKRKPAGNDKTYYHVKDIKFLQHEPLLCKFAELKVYMKKYKKCLGRGDKNSARRLEDLKPDYTLHHLVRERYPTFVDAIRDLDDALSMVALYDALPTDQKREIRSDVIQESARLIHEFFLYIIQTKALKKVFASIKGYYFQALIGGETVTWLVPHKFAQELPVEVDFRVMSTFNEFYRTMLKFINFKLYAEEHFEYPPKFNYKKNAAEMAKFYVSNTVEKQASSEAAVRRGEEKEEVEAACIEDFAAVSEEVQQLQAQKNANAGQSGIFSGLKVFIQREVPFHSIYFVLKCGGAQVGWASLPGSPFKETDRSITHQIIDRPSSQFQMVEGREYVQPQWVLDSFNENLRLPIDPYLPDRTCPPHLSPFVDDGAEGYTPERREMLDKLRDEGAGSSSSSGANQGAAAAKGPVDDEAAETTFLAEVAAEAKGVWASDFGFGNAAEDDEAEDDEAEDDDGEEGSPAVDQTATKEQEKNASGKSCGLEARTTSGEAEASASDDDMDAAESEEKKKPLSKAEKVAAEELERRKAMMPKKHQRLYQRIEKTENKKKAEVAKLQKRRNKKKAATSG